MKITYISDLHVDISKNNKEILTCLINYLAQNKTDVFIIAGDLANSVKDIHESLTKFKSIECTKIYVPGNHDLWIESKNKLKSGFDSSYKYEIELKEIAEKSGFYYPIFEPLIIKDVAFVGTVGWYDYSLRDERLDEKYREEDYNQGKFGNTFWSDFTSSIWLKDRDNSDWKLRSKRLKNDEVFKRVFKQFELTIDLIPMDIKKIVIIIHTAPYANCIERKEEPNPFDAYEGSIEYGKYIELKFNGKKVIFVSGHKHKKLKIEINPNIIFYRSPIGYLDEYKGDLNFFLENNIGEFSI
ncbi:MAG: metallophosphoesterase [Leptospiraceae bacterium]|nr:metallophosphoesterase [Leptospiraceae bacterium]